MHVAIPNKLVLFLKFNSLSICENEITRLKSYFLSSAFIYNADIVVTLNEVPLLKTFQGDDNRRPISQCEKRDITIIDISYVNRY